MRDVSTVPQETKKKNKKTFITDFILSIGMDCPGQTV